MRRSSAFSFIEVMFAVVILGLGFIMIAAMFPITVVQAQATRDESVACNLARDAMVSVAAAASDQTLPPTDGAMAVPRGVGDASPAGVAYGLCSADPRYAWSAIYSRDAGAGYARVVVLVTRVRNTDAYSRADLFSDPDDPQSLPANIEPRGVSISVTEGGTGPDILKVATGAVNDGAAAIAPGAIIVVSSDAQDPANNGRIIQVGNAVDGQTNTWQLAPGAGIRDASERIPKGSRGLLIGRGYLDPARPAGGFGGPSQDLAAFTTFVRVP